MFLVICYDIANNGRRRSLVNVLKDHGYRVNYSVFECELKKDKLSVLKSQISRIIKNDEDSILYYELCRTCRRKRYTDGVVQPAKLEGLINI